MMGIAKTGAAVVGLLLLILVARKSLRRRQSDLEKALPELLKRGPVPVSELGPGRRRHAAAPARGPAQDPDRGPDGGPRPAQARRRGPAAARLAPRAPVSTATMSGRQKAAILLVSLGADASAAVFKHLRQDEIDELTLEIAGIGHVAARAQAERGRGVLRDGPRPGVHRRGRARVRAHDPREGARQRPRQRRHDAAVGLDPGEPVRVPAPHRRRPDPERDRQRAPADGGAGHGLPAGRHRRPGRQRAARRAAGRGRDAHRADGPHRARGDPRDRARARAQALAASSTRTSPRPAACAPWSTC